MKAKQIRHKPGMIFQFKTDAERGMDDTHMILDKDESIYFRLVTLKGIDTGTILTIYDARGFLLNEAIIIRDEIVLNNPKKKIFLSDHSFEG